MSFGFKRAVKLHMDALFLRTQSRSHCPCVWLLALSLAPLSSLFQEFWVQSLGGRHPFRLLHLSDALACFNGRRAAGSRPCLCAPALRHSSFPSLLRCAQPSLTASVSLQKGFCHETQGRIAALEPRHQMSSAFSKFGKLFKRSFRPKLENAPCVFHLFIFTPMKSYVKVGFFPSQFYLLYFTKTIKVFWVNNNIISISWWSDLSCFSTKLLFF